MNETASAPPVDSPENAKHQGDLNSREVLHAQPAGPALDPNRAPELDPRIEAGSISATPHQDAKPGQMLSRIHSAEAEEFARRRRERLHQAAAHAFTEAHGIPFAELLLHEDREVTPEGQVKITFWFGRGTEAYRLRLDADLEIAARVKALGWRWGDDGQLMRPCKCRLVDLLAPGENCGRCKGKGEVPEEEVEPVQVDAPAPAAHHGHDANGSPVTEG